jgi:hypothetical protein
MQNEGEGPAGIRTQVARFKVWSANHYTTEPLMEVIDTFLFINYVYFFQNNLCSWLLHDSRPDGSRELQTTPKPPDQ